MNFLTEHKIEQYADLVSRIEEVNAENEKTADALKSVEKRLADMAVLMKHVTTYQKTKPVYEAYRRAKDKDAYRAKQESSLILHEAAVKTLKAAGVTSSGCVLLSATISHTFSTLRSRDNSRYSMSRPMQESFALPLPRRSSTRVKLESTAPLMAVVPEIRLNTSSAVSFRR